MISKDKLFFDPTDADTILDSDSVGAFVRSSDGTLIDHQSINSTNWLQVVSVLEDGSGNVISSTGNALDVNVTNDLTVDLDGIYVLSTNPTPDNVGIIAFDRAVTPALTDQKFTPTGGLLGSVLAADVTKVHALDTNSFIMGLNGTDYEPLQSVDGALKIYFNDQAADIDVNITNSTLTVSDAALADTAIAAAAVSLGGTALALPSSALAARKYLFVQNLGSRAMYVGPSGVSAASGLRLAPNAVGEFRIGPSISLYGISDGTAQDTRVLELA